MNTRIKALVDETRTHTMAARAITSAAKAEGRGLTPEEDTKVNLLIGKADVAKHEADKLTAAETGAAAIRGSIGAGNAWGKAAKGLIEGTSVSVEGRDLYRRKSVTDGDLGTDEQTGRAVVERPGITEMLLDERFIFGAFPSINPGAALAVSEFVQSSRALGSGSAEADVERDLLSTDPKAELDVEISHTSADMKQVAIMIRDIPNALFEAEGALSGFLSSEMSKQLALAIDAHVVAAIQAASPDTSTGGDSTAAALRYAVADMAQRGVHPSIAILDDDAATEIDTMKAIDLPNAYPYGLSIRTSPSLAGSQFVVEPSVAGVLYLGSVKFDRDPYTGFGENTTDLRAECSLLFVVRNVDGIQEAVAGS